MENRVRDLEQLEECDPDDRGRRLGTVVMATLGMVGLTFAMGVVVGKAAEPRGGDKKDPFDQLDRIAAATTPTATTAGKAATQAAAERVEAVHAADLTFAKSLTEEEDRPEVIAALEAAAREEASLDTSESDELARDAEEELHANELDLAPAPRALATEGVTTTLPAAVAAGSSAQKLQHVAKHDRLIAAALPASEAQERARHGEEGEFTLQVISYDAPEPAHAFASNLRSKGHEAFVAMANLPERGRYYRVRIGPFKTRERAESYRRKFEQDEHMNTIVVKRPKNGA